MQWPPGSWENAPAPGSWTGPQGPHSPPPPPPPLPPSVPAMALGGDGAWQAGVPWAWAPEWPAVPPTMAMPWSLPPEAWTGRTPWPAVDSAAPPVNAGVRASKRRRAPHSEALVPEADLTTRAASIALMGLKDDDAVPWPLALVGASLLPPDAASAERQQRRLLRRRWRQWRRLGRNEWRLFGQPYGLPGTMVHAPWEETEPESDASSSSSMAVVAASASPPSSPSSQHEDASTRRRIRLRTAFLELWQAEAQRPETPGSGWLTLCRVLGSATGDPLELLVAPVRHARRRGGYVGRAIGSALVDADADEDDDDGVEDEEDEAETGIARHGKLLESSGSAALGARTSISNRRRPAEGGVTAAGGREAGRRKVGTAKADAPARRGSNNINGGAASAPQMVRGRGGHWEQLIPAGTDVAFRVKDDDGEWNWILGTVSRYAPEERKYRVADRGEEMVEALEQGQAEGAVPLSRLESGRYRVYTVPRSRVRALPPRAADNLKLSPSLPVLALYPGTSAFYPASVVESAAAVLEQDGRERGLCYKLLFENENEEEEEEEDEQAAEVAVEAEPGASGGEKRRQRTGAATDLAALCKYVHARFVIPLM